MQVLVLTVTGSRFWAQKLTCTRLLPSTDSRIDKDRTGPDLDDRPLSFQYVAESGDPFGPIKLFLATRRHPAVGRQEHPLSGTKATRYLSPAMRTAERSYTGPSCSRIA